MKYAIQINGAPDASQGSASAYRFIEAALRRGHRIVRVFFYHDGVHNAMRHARPPEGKRSWSNVWSDLAKEHDIDLVLCISALQRRGVAEVADERSSDDGSLMIDGFRVGGLAMWVDACLEADRVVVFG
jgi:tRNA 2-thiouridine synthesizing protein D